MKKIMFTDKFGLTQAVLDGRKTMTRRIVKGKIQLGNWEETEKYATYQVGEVVSIAQSYEALANSGYLDKMMDGLLSMKKEYAGVGYKNKMFVKAELMPHHIKITNIRLEHLQDISDKDCIKEGIGCFLHPLGIMEYKQVPILTIFNSLREAFSALIDRVSGKGTWDSNPLVWVYEFQLID